MPSRRKIQTQYDLQDHLSDGLTLLRNGCRGYPPGPEQMEYFEEGMRYMRESLEESNHVPCNQAYVAEMYSDAAKLEVLLHRLLSDPRSVPDGLEKLRQLCTLLSSHSYYMDRDENNLFAFGKKKSLAKKRRSVTKKKSLAKTRRSVAKKKSLTKKRRSVKTAFRR